MAALDRKNPPEYWTGNLRDEWKDYRRLWDDVFAMNTPGVGGMTSARMKDRHEPLRWPCPTTEHPGVSTLYLDHPSWQAAAESLGQKGKRFLTPSGRVEIFTPELDAKLAPAGHRALPPFYAHPETTGELPSARLLEDLVDNPVNPGSATPRAELSVRVARPEGFPLVGVIGRPSVVHFATLTQWTLLGKQLNGIRFAQLHPETAAAAGINNGDTIRVESPRGSITATALLFDGIRRDTVFVPNLFGPQQFVGEEIGLPLYEPANTLVDDRFFDNLSGQQAYKCFACRISSATASPLPRKETQ
jgi:anaerobic selenocysteine-containing dehydrogenase